MLDASFIEKISEMSKPNRFDLGGVVFHDKKMFRTDPPSCLTLKVGQLQSIVDYLQTEMEKDTHYLIHIEGPESVELISRLHTDYRTRERILSAEPNGIGFVFGRYYDVENFVIALQADFVRDEAVEKVLAYVGNMKTSTEVSTRQDGCSQSTQVRTGLAEVALATVPNPVILAPFRTFIEIEQPYSEFVLRLNAAHQCALFEADGGAWKVYAVKAIKLWFWAELTKIEFDLSRVTILA